MVLNMIRYNKTSAGVEWTVIRKGKIVAEGINSTMEAAKILAEQSILESFSAEKIETKVLMGQGDRQLSLMRTTK